jgi:lipopolysaccharide biosynthesis glycosyltransferase
MSRRPIVFACGADDRFAMPMAVSLFSALEQLGDGYDVQLYVVDGGISPANAANLRRVLRHRSNPVEVHLVAADLARLGGLKVSGHLRLPTYFRLLVPEIVPEPYERAIYLDSDLLVRSDPAALWDAEMGESPALAVRECSNPTVSSRVGVLNYRELGLDPEAPYINGGVLVMDLVRWRSERLAQAVLHHTVEYAEFVQFGDQDGLNAVLAGRWGLLDPRWNVPVYLTVDRIFDLIEDSPFKEELRLGRRALLREAHILHFIGARKPWEPGCGLPGQLAWLRALQRSGWYAGREQALRLKTWTLRADWLFRQVLRRVRDHRPGSGPRTSGNGVVTRSGRRPGSPGRTSPGR